MRESEALKSYNTPRENALFSLTLIIVGKLVSSEQEQQSRRKTLSWNNCGEGGLYVIVHKENAEG